MVAVGHISLTVEIAAVSWMQTVEMVVDHGGSWWIMVDHGGSWIKYEKSNAEGNYSQQSGLRAQNEGQR